MRILIHKDIRRCTSLALGLLLLSRETIGLPTSQRSGASGPPSLLLSVQALSVRPSAQSGRPHLELAHELHRYWSPDPPEGEDALLNDLAWQEQRAKEVFAEAIAPLQSEHSDLFQLMESLFEEAMPYFRQAYEKNPIHHNAYVSKMSVEILLGDKATAEELKRGVIAALLHDIGFATSSMKRIRIEEIRNASAEDRPSIRAQAIRSRQEHMIQGARIAHDILQKHKALLSEEDIDEVERVILHHDDPTIQELESDDAPKSKWLFDPADRQMMFQREADRLWMMTRDGLLYDLQKDRASGKNTTMLARLKENIQQHRDEYRRYAEAYPDSYKDFGFYDGTLYRTKTGYSLFLRLTGLNGLRERSPYRDLAKKASVLLLFVQHFPRRVLSHLLEEEAKMLVEKMRVLHQLDWAVDDLSKPLKDIQQDLEALFRMITDIVKEIHATYPLPEGISPQFKWKEPKVNGQEAGDIGNLILSGAKQAVTLLSDVDPTLLEASKVVADGFGQLTESVGQAAEQLLPAVIASRILQTPWLEPMEREHLISFELEGKRLYGYWFPPDVSYPEAPVIMINTPYAWRPENYFPHKDMYQSLFPGAGVLILPLPGQAMNAHWGSTVGAKEPDHLERVIGQLKSWGEVRSRPFFVQGISLGAVINSELNCRKLSGVDGVILEGMPFDLKEAMRERRKDQYGDSFAHLFPGKNQDEFLGEKINGAIALVEKFLSQKLGTGFGLASPGENVKRAGQPTLLIMGDRENVVTADHYDAYRAMPKANRLVQYLEVKGEHLFPGYNDALYREGIKTFMTEVMRERISRQPPLQHGDPIDLVPDRTLLAQRRAA